nr:unnamed protein product [Spirometra erinaceieuropaei]
MSTEIPECASVSERVYDTELEVLAQKWVNRCKFEHPSPKEEEYRLSGQNLGATGGLNGEASIRKVMKMWYDENKNYNYNRNSCNGVCGHYTQMVWWNSNRIGCAMQTCSGIFPGMEANFIACQYVARDLSSTEISLLSKGIRFSHTDAAPTDFLANLESLLLTSDVPDDMCADIRSCATGLLRQRKHHQTLLTEEEKALRSLKTDDKIVIMSADKEGATVIVTKVDYVNKANQIFDEREAYAPLAADPTKKQVATIKKKVNELARLKLISPDDSRAMTLNDPRIARAYGLPKVHKTAAPLRIIVPLIGSPTYNLAKWLYRHLKHLANGSQYSIKNSQAFLQKIQGLEGQVGGSVRTDLYVALIRQISGEIENQSRGDRNPDAVGYIHPSLSEEGEGRCDQTISIWRLLLLLLLAHSSNSGRSGDCPAHNNRHYHHLPDYRDEDQDYTCPHCDRTFTSHIGLVGHLRIHRIENGEPVREEPTYTHRTRLHCPHCPRTFRHRMGLFGHMRIHESGLDRTADTPTTSNTSTVHTPTLFPSARAITTTTTASSVADTDTADFSCPHCPRTFTSRIGLVGHLRIYRTETGKPVPGAPTYTHKARLNCPHCPRTFRHRMGLFGHMRIHDDLR